MGCHLKRSLEYPTANSWSGVGGGSDDEGDDGFKDGTDDGEECDRDQLTHSVVLLRAESRVVPRVFLFRRGLCLSSLGVLDRYLSVFTE